MASLLNSFFGAKAAEATEEAETDNHLGEPRYLEPEEYEQLKPMFPSIQEEGDPVAKPVLRRLNFKDTKLSKYDIIGAYAVVIDDAFTLKECDELVRIAEDSSSEGWPIAQVNVGENLQITNTSYRNSDRIIYDDKVLADKLLNRIKPLIDRDIAYLDPNYPLVAEGALKVKGTAAKRRGDKFRMTRLNERLRYLRYPVSGFFKMHCDGSYTTPNFKESTIYTIQVYLNDNTGDVPLKGGATRFWEPGSRRASELSNAELKKRGIEPPGYLDVEPIPGRVLVFQHAHLLHSGEPITAGIKLTIRSDILYERVPETDVEIELKKHLERNGLLADEIPVDPKDEVGEDTAIVN